MSKQLKTRINKQNEEQKSKNQTIPDRVNHYKHVMSLTHDVFPTDSDEINALRLKNLTYLILLHQHICDVLNTIVEENIHSEVESRQAMVTAIAVCHLDLAKKYSDEDDDEE